MELSTAQCRLAPLPILENSPMNRSPLLRRRASVLLMLALAGWLSWQNQANELRGREQALQQNVETASAVLRWAHGLQSAKVLAGPTRARAHAQPRGRLCALGLDAGLDCQH